MYKIMTMALMAGILSIGIVGITTTDAFAQDPARGELDRADVNIHENTDSTPQNLSEQDIRFHEGICQGGHSTTVLDTAFGGCKALGSPGGR